MTGFASKRRAAQAEQTIGCVNHDCEQCQAQQEQKRLVELGWQEIDCPICGGGARAFPKPEQEPVAFGALARRRVLDYIRGAYDLGYNDARQARTVPGDGAPGYKGRDVEADHGGALIHALETITTPPKRQPLTDAAMHLSNLVDALDNAFISSWQSTYQWQKQLDDAREYLAAHGIKE